MAEGWIKLHRNIKGNALWGSEPFTKAQAWIDILLRVNHKVSDVAIGNQIIKVDEGQTIWSMKNMAETWKWSNRKVNNFLEMLKKAQQIDYKCTTKYTIVTVENWCLYQNENEKSISKTDKMHNESITKAQQKHTNKNDKNEKKNIYSALNDDLEKQTEEIWSLYPSKTGKGVANKKIPELINKHGYGELVRTIERYKDYVEKMRANGFKGLNYKNGSTFFNGGYVDYLDKNYEAAIAIQNERNVERTILY